MKLNNKQIRQGDVLLDKINALPAGRVEIEKDKDGALTLAHGEMTGHRHRFELQAGEFGSALGYGAPNMPTEPANIELLVTRALVHEEHGAPTVEQGVYRVSRPYEYAGAELPRRVED